MPAIIVATTGKYQQHMREPYSKLFFAASGDDARPVLTGVYVHNIEGNLYMVQPIATA